MRAGFWGRVPHLPRIMSCLLRLPRAEEEFRFSNSMDLRWPRWTLTLDYEDRGKRVPPVANSQQPILHAPNRIPPAIHRPIQAGRVGISTQDRERAFECDDG